MTQTTTLSEPPPEAPTGPDIPLHPSDILMSLIVACLAPMFLSASAGDIGFARLAAIETVNAYRLRDQADLVAVAQIIAFGLAALGSLSLSMADDISLSMTLRLRGNAVALNRSAEQNRRVLREAQVNDPTPHHAALPAEPEPPAVIAEDDAHTNAAEVLLNVAAAQELAAQAEARLQGPEQATDPAAPTAAAPMTAEKRHQAMWAIAMVKEAGEIAVTIPNLPPTERRAASIRAAALSSAANELLTGVGSRPSWFGTPMRPGTAESRHGRP